MDGLEALGDESDAALVGQLLRPLRLEGHDVQPPYVLPRNPAELRLCELNRCEINSCEQIGVNR